MRRPPVLLVLALMLSTTSAASAQLGRMAFGLKAGTLGFGAETAVGISRHLSVRAGLNRFHLTRDQAIEGITYEMTPRLQSVTALVDLHPFGSAFRLTSGIVLNRNGGDLAAKLGDGDALTIGDHQYGRSEIESLRGSIGFKRSAPYAGLGFDNALRGTSRVSMSLDLGVMFHGHPQATLTAQSRLTGTERTAFDRDVRLEAAEIQDRIDSLPRFIDFYPVVALGLKVRV
jgi:hypothetical protein